MANSRGLAERTVQYYLGNGPSLVWLLALNGVAFLAGVRYYLETMAGVPTLLWPLYGDSPTALALATLSLATLLPRLGERVTDAPRNRPLAYLHTLAFVWLFKYGVWTAVALNLRAELYFGVGLDALWSYWGIVITHLWFLVEAAAITYYGATTRGALALSLLLLLLNDAFDYGLGYHPPLRYAPGATLTAITVALSVGATALAARAFRPLDAAPGGSR